MSLSAAQVYALARSVGLPHNGAVIATSIAWAESGLNPNALGDVSLEDGTWGPSVGLWQVRSLKNQQGTGGTRDASKLTDPNFNARSMYQISGGGASWAAWSTYTSGAYRQFLPQVQAAVGDGSKVPPASSFGGLGSTRPQTPANVGGGAGGGVQDASLLGDLGGLAWNATPFAWFGDLFGGGKNPVTGWVDDLIKEGETAGLTVLLYAVGLGLGATLIGIGAWRIAEPVIKPAATAAAGALA